MANVRKVFKHDLFWCINSDRNLVFMKVRNELCIAESKDFLEEQVNYEFYWPNLKFLIINRIHTFLI